MAKTYKKLWPELISFNNLYLAYKKAARGKRSKPGVASFEYKLEYQLFQLQEELRTGSYQPGALPG